MSTAPGKGTARRPKLTPRLRPDVFASFYWLKAELTAFAVANGIRASGKKLDVAKRIEAFLRSGTVGRSRPARSAEAGRDSDRPITMRTPVKRWVCDARTRAFFEGVFGPRFHFTVALNRLGRTGKGLTYGDLVAAWRDERERRRDPSYKPRLGKSGEYNLYVRAYFADPANKGKSLAQAAKAWNRVKKRRGPRVYDRKRGW